MKNINIEAVLSYGKVFTGRKKYFFNFVSSKHKLIYKIYGKHSSFIP